MVIRIADSKTAPSPRQSSPVTDSIHPVPVYDGQLAHHLIELAMDDPDRLVPVFIELIQRRLALAIINELEKALKAQIDVLERELTRGGEGGGVRVGSGLSLL